MKFVVPNPYEPCVGNKVIENNQHALTWHEDDVKASRQHSEVNDKFEKWYKKSMEVIC